MKEFAEEFNWPAYLRNYRSHCKISQVELAQGLHVGLNTIQKWEAGVHQPPPYLKVALIALIDSPNGGKKESR